MILKSLTFKPFNGIIMLQTLKKAKPLKNGDAKLKGLRRLLTLWPASCRFIFNLYRTRLGKQAGVLD